ncbi:protein spindle-F [Diachasma alloeum]|uniref:protein spindle-F n=1 Tax=Diachasma alloeum TaxID=454923 RepID=UPI0007382AB9|nr:protein spindle-F [Diachasma alloeum]XP_015124809.1 protein spindle-F [Diachasma alloeum]XP_015124810.1 protein spindle-F [Diachasma alloeum]
MPNGPVGEESTAAQHALQIAFQTMQERCQQLENRLAAVEEENVRLRVEKGTDLDPDIASIDISSEAVTIQRLQEKVEELTKQKSQLSHHILMVAAENRQLWNRLTRLTRTNKTLGSKLIKISDTLKQHPAGQALETSSYSIKEVPQCAPKGVDAGESQDAGGAQGDASLEEISLRLINSIMMEKVELEQQYSEMVALQNGADINIRNVGFAYPDEGNNDSLQQLKQHESKLLETKDALLSQQIKLKKVLQNLKRIRKASKKVCQTGTQFDSDDSLREHGATQTSLPPAVSLESDKVEGSVNKTPDDAQICPMCGAFFGKSVPFETFHEHVLSHFSTGSPSGFELLP